MTSRSHKFGLLIGGFLWFCMTGFTHAQVQYVAEEWGVVPVPGLENHSVSVMAYVNANDDSSLILSPFYCMKADKDGRLVVDLDKPDLNNQMTKLTVYVIKSPKNYIDAIANLIQTTELMKFPRGKYANINSIQLITPTVKDLRIEDTSTPMLFSAVPLPGSGLVGEIPVSALIPTHDAAEYADDLRNGRVNLTLSLMGTLDARRTQTTIRLSGSTIRAVDTDAYKRLVGNGGAFKYGVDDAGGSFEPAALTREQRDQFLGDVKSEIKTRINITGRTPEGYQQFMQQLNSEFTDFISKAFKEQTVSNMFGVELSRLYRYDFDPSDLTPDQIDKLVAKIQHDFADQTSDKMNIQVDAKASGFFGLASGEVNTNINKEILHKRMENRGWSFDSPGKFGVPRGMKIYIVDKQNIRSTGTFVLDMNQGVFAPLLVSEKIPASLRVDPGKAVVPDPWASVVELKQRLTALDRPGGIIDSMAGKISQIQSRPIVTKHEIVSVQSNEGNGFNRILDLRLLRIQMVIADTQNG